MVVVVPSLEVEVMNEGGNDAILDDKSRDETLISGPEEILHIEAGDGEKSSLLGSG